MRQCLDDLRYHFERAFLFAFARTMTFNFLCFEEHGNGFVSLKWHETLNSFPEDPAAPKAQIDVWSWRYTMFLKV